MNQAEKPDNNVSITGPWALVLLIYAVYGFFQCLESLGNFLFSIVELILMKGF